MSSDIQVRFRLEVMFEPHIQERCVLLVIDKIQILEVLFTVVRAALNIFNMRAKRQFFGVDDFGLGLLLQNKQLPQFLKELRLQNLKPLLMF